MRVDITNPLITKAWTKIRAVAEQRLQEMGKDEHPNEEATATKMMIEMDDEDFSNSVHVNNKPRSMVETVFLQSAITNNNGQVPISGMEIEMDI